MTVPRPIRVLHVNTARSWRGGERQTLLLARGLVERGHIVRLVCQPGCPLSRRAAEGGVPVAELPMRGEWDLVAAARLARLWRRFGADLCHLHTARAHTLGLLARMWGPGPPAVVSRRVDFGPGWTSRWKYRFPGLRYAAVSENVRQVLIKSGVDASKVRTVYSGIPLGPAPERAPGVREGLGIGAAKRIVISVAALAPHKDHRTLLEATRILVGRVPDVHVLLVGEGSLEKDIRRQVRSLGLEGNVTLAGFQEDVRALLAEAEIFVSSSWLEGLGTSILDAMAAGVPIVATAVGGVPEMVRDGREGRLVPPRDPQALAEALTELLTRRGHAEELGRAAARRAAEFDIARTVEETEALYREILAGAAAA